MSVESGPGTALPRRVLVGRLRRRHALPFPGHILVEVGERVVTGQIWCRGQVRNGVVVVDLPRLLQVQPDEVRELLAVEPGVMVEAETPLAGTPGRLRTGRHWLAPSRGMLTEVNEDTGVAVFVREIHEAVLYCRLEGEVVAADPEDGIVVEGEGVAVAGALGGGPRGRRQRRVDHDRPGGQRNGPTAAPGGDLVPERRQDAPGSGGEAHQDERDRTRGHLPQPLSGARTDPREDARAGPGLRPQPGFCTISPGATSISRCGIGYTSRMSPADRPAALKGSKLDITCGATPKRSRSAQRLPSVMNSS